MDGETTWNDTLHLNSGAKITGDVVVNGTNLLQIIALLDARIAALEAGGGETPSASFTCGTSTVTFDGHDYSTVEIGSQCWFAENLRSEHYANGDAIPEVTDGVTWGNTSDGARVAYNNDAANVSTYGYLYNWFAVDSDAGLCPGGWHVPSDGEWTELTDFLDGESVAGAQMKSSSSDTPSWNGTNSSGFSALPGGYRYGYGNFSPSNNVGNNGYWWSASSDGGSAWNRALVSDSDYVYRNGYSRRYGFSVRCVRD